MALADGPAGSSEEGGATASNSPNGVVEGWGVQVVDRRDGDAALVENRTNWHVNAPLLYDYFIDVTLEWSALSVAWLADVDGQLPRFAFGTHSNETHDEVVICQLEAELDESLYIDDVAQVAAGNWKRWRCDVGETIGFGLVEDEIPPLRTIARLWHPTEVNRIAPCLHRPQLLATKTANGAVLLFDYERERDHNSREADPDARLTPPDAGDIDGFALSWSSLRRHCLVSGGNDGRCCLWDVTIASQAGLLHNFIAHDGALCDAAFSRHEIDLLATVGDDRALHLWDLRAPLGGQQRRSSLSAAAEGEVLTVDWSHHCQYSLASSGKDRQVRVWDTRSLREPCKSLPGHTGDCVVVRWAPPNEGQSPNVLASCATNEMIIWDLSAQEAKQAEELSTGVMTEELSKGRILGEEDARESIAPELLFQHRGHFGGIADFSYNLVDRNLLCSADNQGHLQIWSPQCSFDLVGSEDAAEGEQELEGNAGDSAERAPSPSQKKPRLA